MTVSDTATSGNPDRRSSDDTLVVLDHVDKHVGDLHADPLAAGRQDHASGDHQPVRGGVEGNQPRLRVHRPGLTFVRKQIDTDFQNQLHTVIVVAGLYVSVNLVLTWIATWVQRKFVGEKKILEVSMVAETDAGAGLTPSAR